MVFAVYHYLGIKKHGFVGYHKAMVPPGAARLHRPVHLLPRAADVLRHAPAHAGLRLFANMFAGHLLLLVFILGGEYMLLHGGLGLKVMSSARSASASS
jgi:F-type H+-transporting ATPase subunit a